MISLEIDEQNQIVIEIDHKLAVGQIVLGRDNSVVRCVIERRTGTIDQWREAGRRIPEGVLGWAKATLGVDRPADDVIGRRREICQACESNKDGYCGRLLRQGRRTCGCRIESKIKVAGQECPQGKW